MIADFNRIMTTVFNGASNVAQAGGLACLQDAGWAQMLALVEFYKENAAILAATFREMGFTVYGGENAPYVWVGFPGEGRGRGGGRNGGAQRAGRGFCPVAAGGGASGHSPVTVIKL